MEGGEWRGGSVEGWRGGEGKGWRGGGETDGGMKSVRRHAEGWRVEGGGWRGGGVRGMEE